MIVRIAPEADADLEEIADFIAQDDPVRADSFVAELQAACHRLADFPTAYPLVPRLEASGVRRRTYGNYAVFYQVAYDVVTVLRIIHGARNHDEMIFPN